ncbi:hypothetical protein V8E51_015015 [Hyaloscypha variabilis]
MGQDPGAGPMAVLEDDRSQRWRSPSGQVVSQQPRRGPLPRCALARNRQGQPRLGIIWGLLLFHLLGMEPGLSWIPPMAVDVLPITLSDRRGVPSGPLTNDAQESRHASNSPPLPFSAPAVGQAAAVCLTVIRFFKTRDRDRWGEEERPEDREKGALSPAALSFVSHREWESTKLFLDVPHLTPPGPSSRATHPGDEGSFESEIRLGCDD